MRWTVLVDADLSFLDESHKKVMVQILERDYLCTLSWRKDRHSRDGMVVPYRLSVRGVEAETAMAWILDTLCSEHSDIVKPDDIWACPVPETDQQEFVEKSLRGIIVRTVHSTGRLDAHRKPLEVKDITSHPSGGECFFRQARPPNHQ